MIVYFADRHLNILGQASTRLPKGITIADDLKTSDVDTGVSIFECDILFDRKTRADVEAWADVGNYILRSSGGEYEVYNIIDAEIDTKKKTVHIYAEDDGLDLINEVAEPYEADQSYPIATYIERFTAGSGWEIGINEIEGLTKQLNLDSEKTVCARVLEIAEGFDNAEISYSFVIDGLTIVKRLINIYEERGKDTGIQLRLNKEIDRIITTKSIANLATALQCTGGTPDNSEEPVTLLGLSYDDGDFYVDGAVLKSRKALEKWSRFLWKSDESQQSGGHIVKQFSFDTLSQEKLCVEAIEELKKICDAEINYEVDFSKFPENVRVGDRVNIIDDNGNLYLSSRILTLETSDCEKTHRAILGEHIIRESGISQTVAGLAKQFSELANKRAFFTWIAYADDKFGNGISLDPTGKDYLGIATNKKVNVVNISDPSIFTWSKIKGEQGEPGKDAEDANNIVKLCPEYYLSDSSTTQTGGYWSEILPEWSSGKYIWERQRVVWSDGTISYSDPVLNSALNHANEAAEFAQQQAQTAANSATSAERAAANAETEAQEAKEAATEAGTLAQSASEKAEQAQAEAAESKAAVDLANKDIEQINSEIANVKENAASVREEMQRQINTVTETMTADYAKKTELSETEASLKSEISKSVAELQTTMQTDYSKKTDLTDVQATLQTQITQNATDIQSTVKSVEDVKVDTTNAKQKADEAKAAADAAQNTADTAKTEAEAAQNAADAATTAAQNAQNEATAAQSAADKANTAAKNAQAVAEAAENDLEEAKAELVAVTGRVDATEEDIAKAQTAVEQAQAAADQAKADVIRAENAAAEAQSTADTAKANAETAQAAASTAQTDANNAKAAADKAQADADKALEDLAELGDRVTAAETSITQNSEQILLRATKTEVSETVNNIKIGGRNLAIASAANYENPGFNVPTSTIAGENDYTITEELYNATTVARWSGSDNSIYSGPYFGITTMLGATLEIDGIYTISAWVKADKETNIRAASFGEGQTVIASQTIVKTEWDRIWLVFKATKTDGNICFYTAANATTDLPFIYMCGIKLEKGNKATDWSPAPEDMATAEEVENAQSTADSASSKADTNSEKITITESAIKQLSDSISMLVTDESGSSLMTQTENGWTFSTKQIQDTVNSISENLNTLVEEQGSTKATVDVLDQAIKDLEKTADYVRISSYENEPCIELGESDSDYSLMITNTRILFRVGSNTPTRINADGLVTQNIEVENEIRQGGFIQIAYNGWGLLWKGSDS